MSDLRKLSEVATPGEWGRDIDGFASPRLFATGFETYDGSEVLALFRRSDGVSHDQALANCDYVAALVKEHRSGSLIPRTEHERVLALLAEARESKRALLALHVAHHNNPLHAAARAALSRIDAALAAEPEARG